VEYEFARCRKESVYSKKIDMSITEKIKDPSSDLNKGGRGGGKKTMAGVSIGLHKVVCRSGRDGPGGTKKPATNPKHGEDEGA